MLASVLSCQVGAAGSGTMARHAGVAIGADAWLPSMANEAFLGCLSKAALNEAAMVQGVGRFDRAKDTRAAMCRAFEQRTYVHPQARFALTAEELEAERRPVPGLFELEDEAAAGDDGSDEAADGAMADSAVREAEADVDVDVDGEEQEPMAA
jgi:ParB family chromosome partitioning protein